MSSKGKDKIEYVSEDGVFATIKINGEPIRCRSFKLEHGVDGLATATVEIVAPDAHITALADHVIRKVTLKYKLHDWWKGHFK